MGTKTISLGEEAYERLKSRKREGESFTDVVLRLTEENEDVLQGFGAWKDTDLRNAVEEGREEYDRDYEKRYSELFE
ncbi:antitoxin VapB family protein [Halorussus pelagicus]|uniref:antitoxin VapB family protein n=1 Tax=Halorussus pelagicus TaxID=2505977 RepID=UPI000FFCA660|nr:antitoxin VapB family protein [Halorussus pelagicus]